MATLVCSNGHANPVGQRFCGTCGEDLTAPGETPSDAAAVVTEPTKRRWFPWVALGMAALFAAVTVGVVLAGRDSGSPSAPTGTTVARGTQTIVWYFPVSTPDTELTTTVDQECAAHPEVGTIQVDFIDMGSGSLTPVDTRRFTCP